MDANNILETQAAPLEEVVKELEKFNDSGDLVVLADEHDTDLQQRMWDLYVQSVIAGAPKIKESGVKAGYTEYSADRISTQKWFKDRKKRLDRIGLLSDAENNLKKLLNTPYIVTRTKNGEKYQEVDAELARLVLDVSKTVVKSLGKDEGYSERSEVTGKGGEPIVFMPAQLLEKYGLDKK